jgi:hypothetical protein
MTIVVVVVVAVVDAEGRRGGRKEQRMKVFSLHGHPFLTFYCVCFLFHPSYFFYHRKPSLLPSYSALSLSFHLGLHRLMDECVHDLWSIHAALVFCTIL